VLFPSLDSLAYDSSRWRSELDNRKAESACLSATSIRQISQGGAVFTSLALFTYDLLPKQSHAPIKALVPISTELKNQIQKKLFPKGTAFFIYY